jgi:hypothetical protein
MDWNFLVGVGTIILAIATLFLVFQNGRQMDVMLRQLNMQIGQQIPRLFIKQVDFRLDSIEIEIQNAADVPATSVGLETSFFVIGQHLYADQKGDNEISWGEAIRLHDQGETVYSKYYWTGPESPKLKFENREVNPSAAVSFFSPQGVSVYFPPHTTMRIATKPVFLISWKGDQGLPSYKGFGYTEFRDFLLSNNIRAVAVVMSLLCKDAAEAVHHQGTVASFAIRTDLDRSLVESSQNAQHFDFIALAPTEWLSEKSWIPHETYQNIRSNWHVF